MNCCDSLEGWDRTFLNISSKLAEPFCTAYGLLRYRLVTPLDPQKFDNCSTKAAEIATRTFIVLGTLFTGALCVSYSLASLGLIATMGIGSKLFRALGFALQKNNFTHVRGNAPEKTLDPKDPKVTIETRNLCGIGGDMSKDHGGVNGFRLRVKAAAQKILEEDYDVLVLQEIVDTDFAEALIEELKDHRAHFYIHLGPNVMGSTGACMVISKYPAHRFLNISFTNNDWTLNRCFAVLEIKDQNQPIARIIGTHLMYPGPPGAEKKRAEQVAQIVDFLAREKLALPTVFAADANIDRDAKEAAILAPYLHPGYTGKEPTCTYKLLAQWDPKLFQPDETVDYVSLFKRATLPDGRTLAVIDQDVSLEDHRLLRSFNETYNTRTAISDHHGVGATLRFSSLMRS